MHIEPGVLNAAKIVFANAAAISTLAVFAPKLLGRPQNWIKTVLAALFFSIFMEVYSVPVGPSELHFIGASAVYLLFGFVPALFGFAIGLLLQGLFFEPSDLMHLAVNSLSLLVPLIAAHGLFGRHFHREGGRRISWAEVVKFDAVFYGGVVMMVGFWLSLGQEPAALSNWAMFAAAYMPIILLEPVFTCLIIRVLKRYENNGLVQRFTTVKSLTAA